MIKKVYIVHHSHTDVGYTDLQEQIIYNQINNIRNVVSLVRNGYEQDGPEKGFKWNCETYYCVEQFLKSASPREQEDFFELVRKGNIGISATYLNFNDLADADMLDRRTAEMQALFTGRGLPVRAAMNADINGISLGARDALIKNGIEFLFTNIHTHHGMYPLYQNQTPYFWESEGGGRLLVWNGEHYNLGNALGIVFNRNVNYMTESYFGKKENASALDALHDKLGESIREYEDSGYPYDFYITSVSGVFSDNAPANPAIIATVNAFNKRFGEEVELRMVTLEELYGLIREQTAEAPVYRGAINDWWGNGVGSTPYAVKHYREALRLAHTCDRLEEKTGVRDDGLARTGEDNALLYAEHTWGHSATITDPYDTMVTNLDIRKTSYASKAHEAAAMRKSGQCHLLGDILRYYNNSGQVKAVSTSATEGLFAVEFYVETLSLPGVKVWDARTGETFTVQLSSHPRGVLVSFAARFGPLEERVFDYEEQPAPEEKLYTRAAWVGAERVRDIVNTYDAETYKLPYGLENDWFRIRYRIGEGITSFYHKKGGIEMLKEGLESFFTPVYECTEIRKGVYGERSRLGRNIRGLHAEQYQADLKDIKILDHGPVFDQVELEFELEGTYHSSVIIKLYRQLPRIEFAYQVAKTLSTDIESLYMPLSLNLPGSSLHIHNGGVAMRPGVDQLPGSNMEYYMADQGVLYQRGGEGILINALDTSLLYMGRMEHHPILLCDNREENNHRPVYSWIMNNTWETNFKMDLSGFGEFRYALELREGSLEENLRGLKENDMGTVAFIVG
ncbi:hypothetical protein [uncultured Acetatifactor sp.]|uniref:glycoside hydrolase family 38 N-terminal domain-containing protein n=1 Tax=uncultured Acetatifactor sp. TaxID=1671927 RepID=UPI002634C7D2|nr:hypothetical protein [uncultured Acetatifactor sp.]